MQPVAVIGLSTLFPGASDPNTFWENLVAGKDSRVEAGPEQMDADPNRATTDFNTQGTFYGNSSLGTAGQRRPNAITFMGYGNTNYYGYYGMVRGYDPTVGNGAICNPGGGSLSSAAATVLCRQMHCMR